MFRHITLICATLLLFSGVHLCQDALAASLPHKAAESANETPQGKILLHDSIELKHYELPFQALQKWYTFRDLRPALLLYSNDPLMQPAPAAIQKRLLERLAAQDREALRYDSPDPAIMPKMALHSALEAGLFSAVYWMMPTGVNKETLSVETFRTQMVEFGAMSDEEAKSLTLHDGVFSGTVRGLPFHALHPQAEVKISGPAVLHFDLSFLAPLYQGEIKTGIYSLVYQTLKQLRDQQVKAIFASVSYSQVSGEIPLSSRFVGDVLAQLFKQPDMLDEKLPQAWQQRANALYLPEMFLSGETRKLLLQLAQNNPEDASLQFALYQVSRELKATAGAALGHLAEAVQHDPVYSLEYLALASEAGEKGLPYEAQRMLRLALESHPNNPFIALKLAQGLIDAKHGESAIPLLEQLLELKWAALFYPNIREHLQGLLDEARSQGSVETNS
ncbi:hypothetical protein P9J64_11535 [Deltaproteobacteria bacterium IMCC39524]|nr:hypothetical protein [Deltaproteobacteria bacterium IMCC39524]